MVRKNNSSVKLKSKTSDDNPESNLNPLKIRIYLNLSNNTFNEENLSLQFQKNAILAYLRKNFAFNEKEIPLIYYIDEESSTKEFKQNQLSKLLFDLDNETINYTFIYKLDHLAHSIETKQDPKNQIVNKHSRFISVKENLDSATSMGKFFLSVLGSMVNLEKENLMRNAKDSLKQFISEKSFSGATPFGYIYSLVTEGEYTAYTEKNAEQFNIPPIKVYDKSNDEIYPGLYVQYIFDWFISYGAISKVAKRLNDLAIPIPRVIQEHFKIYLEQRESGERIPKYILISKPGFWSRTTVRDILLNPFYTGIRVWNRFDSKTKKERAITDWLFIDNTHEKIIDEKTYVSATALYEEIKKTNK